MKQDEEIWFPGRNVNMYDVVVIGAGVVGCAIARQLSRYKVRVAVLEAGTDVAMGASRANSAIVHAGYDCKPGTNMARVNVAGNALFDEWCRDLHVPLKRIGSLVVAFSEEEMEKVRQLYDQGVQNGVPGMQLLGRDATLEKQPGLAENTVGSLWAPTGAITCPYEMTIACAENAHDNGVEFYFDFRAEKITTLRDAVEVEDDNNVLFRSRYVVNAAGIHADEISRMMGDDSFTIDGRKGEYILLDRSASGFVQRVVFQAPSALGKGVLICNTREEARDAVRSMMIDNRFGMSGSRVVIEEFLTGPEVSVLAFTDGKCIKPMVSSMDHKRALDHDEGLNTGGMGTIAPNPYYTADVAKRCMEEIFLPTVHAMNAEGRTFRGCLYFGLMLTPKGPKVIEYNCRFGDPETQVVLPLLESDLLTIMQATVNGTLEQTEVRFSKKNACCVVLASGGYPQHYETGYPISGLDEAGKTAHVYHAGTKLDADGTVLTGGGRVLGVTATGDTLEEAIAQAYQAAEKISFTDLHMRRDIGQRALAAQH